jgi:hypothetical protein
MVLSFPPVSGVLERFVTSPIGRGLCTQRAGRRGRAVPERALDEVDQGEGRFYAAELQRLKGSYCSARQSLITSRQSTVSSTPSTVTGEVVGAARRYEPQSAVTASGQVRCGDYGR